MVLIRKTDFAYAVAILLLALGANGWVSVKLQHLCITKTYYSKIQRPYKIIISDHSEEIYSPKCRINASFGDSGKFNYYVEYLSNIRFLFIHTAIYFQSDDGKYDLELLNRTVDLCKFYKNKRYEPILQAAYKVFEDYTTHWFKCPVNKV